ncbi:MAG: nucleoside hydrolase [Prevotella sp.]|nr:nucleoside hydrolase [Prevotella sp.]
MKNKMISLVALLLFALAGHAQLTKVRVLIDNDFCGDPDGLFQLAHQVLCPSTDIVGIVGGHLSPQGGFTNRKDQATESVEKANELLDLMGMKGKYKVVPGMEQPLASSSEPVESEGSRLIVSEARKCSPDKPLYVLCGAALSNVASALLQAPEISKNMVVVWIGGQEYSFGAVPPPGYSSVEYNLNLSIPAGQVVFNKSDVRIWQIPRDVYRQCLYSTAEMHACVRPCGKVGKFLSDTIDQLMARLDGMGIAMGETYILGDSPLVLMTSLQSGFEADPSSSRWTPAPCPLIDDNGHYQPNPTGRIIRIYTQIDSRLMFGDMVARLQQFKP